MRTLPLLLAFAAASVSAASPNVGVVDVADVMSKYTKAIEIKGGIDQSLAQSKAQVEQKGKELEALKADFDKTVKDANNPMLNESGKKAAVGEAQAKQQNLQQRFNEYQQFVQQAQASIQARAGELEKAVLADVKTAAEKVAKEKGLQLILRRLRRRRLPQRHRRHRQGAERQLQVGRPGARRPRRRQAGRQVSPPTRP